MRGGRADEREQQPRARPRGVRARREERTERDQMEPRDALRALRRGPVWRRQMLLQGGSAREGPQRATDVGHERTNCGLWTEDLGYPRVRRSCGGRRGAEPQRIGSPLTQAGRLGLAGVKCGARGAAVVDV